MTTLINASTTAGLIQTADTSGNLSLQSNGTTILALTSAGAAVTGTLSASGATTLSGNTAVTGTLSTTSTAVIGSSTNGSIQINNAGGNNAASLWFSGASVASANKNWLIDSGNFAGSVLSFAIANSAGGVIGSGATEVVRITSTGMTINSLPITPAEGTFTPIDASGASLSFTSALGKYKKIGSIVWFSFQCIYPSTGSAAAAAVGGLPFTNSSTGPDNVTGTMQTNGSVAGSMTVNGSATSVNLQLATTAVQFTNAQLSTLFIRASGFYFTT